jgi:hypothetical protein
MSKILVDYRINDFLTGTFKKDAAKNPQTNAFVMLFPALRFHLKLLSGGRIRLGPVVTNHLCLLRVLP